MVRDAAHLRVRVTRDAGDEADRVCNLVVVIVTGESLQPQRPARAARLQRVEGMLAGDIPFLLG